MKLGKALATGFAEERPEDHEEQSDVEVLESLEESAAPASEEVPVTR
ncbi:hypothetical protein AB0N87_06325 [Streptomyces sp. NPDC093228]|jgi:hypothetical protein|nr:MULTISPECIES: hypothetical protein [unclassified Streptomyces]REE59930.1 hypothetical protein BX257_2452 [Streptomyces sp. 3212.3]